MITHTSGHLYGTTSSGGAHEAGTIFELTLNAAKTARAETVLYTFCTEVQGSSCIDGEIPYAGLIKDKLDNLYGTMSADGTHNRGTVFER